MAVPTPTGELEPDANHTFGPDGGTVRPDRQALSAGVSAAWLQARAGA